MVYHLNLFKIRSNMNLCEETFYVKIYDRYSEDLYKFLLYKYQDFQSAEDITQNIFLKIWENCKEYHLTNFKSLLFTMGNREALNQIKKQQTRDQYDPLVNFSYKPETPEFIIEEKEFDLKLQRALQKLKPEQRVVFLLHRVEKKKYKEIAEELEISIKTVEKRIHDALLFLRSEIVELKKY